MTSRKAAALAREFETAAPEVGVCTVVWHVEEQWGSDAHLAS